MIFNKKNQGFAKANNKASELANGKYLYCLNNDTEVKKFWLSPLVEILEQDSNVAAVGSKLIFPDGTLQHAGIGITNTKENEYDIIPFHIDYKLNSDSFEVNIPKEVSALTAASLLIRKEIFQKVDGFDENFWNGYEDLDLCFKIQKLEKKLIYEPKSELIHLESQSGPERFSKNQQNVNYLYNKWFKKISYDIDIFNNPDEYFSKHPVSSRQLDDLSQICQDTADGSPRYTYIDKLFRSSAFLSAARARDILHASKSHSSLNDLWDELEFYKFYWNVNDLNKKVIIRKYTEYVKSESLLNSFKSYALLGLSHMAYLVSIPMKIVVDVIDMYTKNHDLDSPIRSLAIIPFVPKMPVQFDVYGFIVFLTWPILGLLFSPFLRELASILLRKTYSSFCQLFSFGKLNAEISESNLKSVPSETIAPGGIFGSWTFKSLLSSLECMWPCSNREPSNVKKD